MPKRAPLHERVKLLGWVREPLRAALFGFLRKVAQTDDGRAVAAAAFRDVFASPRTALEQLREFNDAPFPDLPAKSKPNDTCLRQDVIFITGRFRSGSTLLWNLFRHVPGCTAYYEPLNERRWFDPAIRGERIDQTHRKVEDYWKEYDGLQVLGAHYREHWIHRALFMNEDSWDADLKRYVEILIERAPGRPVLQFNRIDFRLPWFRWYFPGARIVHLYRHPRDQWCSSLMKLGNCPKDGDMACFARSDGFYLLTWARDLKYQFPFLDETTVAHPYQLFYYIWKLSYLFGRKYAHYSVAFENLVSDPETQLQRLFAALDVQQYDVEQSKGLIVKPPLGKWKEYADDAWFRQHELACETVLAEFLGQASPALPAGLPGEQESRADRDTTRGELLRTATSAGRSTW